METEGETRNPRKGRKRITRKQKEESKIRVRAEKCLRGFGRKSRDIRKEENSPHKRPPAHDAYWKYKRVTNFLVLFGVSATRA